MQRATLRRASAFLIAAALALPLFADAPPGSPEPFVPEPYSPDLIIPGLPPATPLPAPSTPAVPAPAPSPATAQTPAPGGGSSGAIIDGGPKGGRARTSTRGAMHRLASLDKRIDQAAKEGRYTHEQARLLHRDIASIRLKLKKSADGSGPKLTGIEEGRLESGLRAQDQPEP